MKIKLTLLILITMFLIACGGGESETIIDEADIGTEVSTSTVEIAISTAEEELETETVNIVIPARSSQPSAAYDQVGYTYIQPDGNRLVSGQIDLAAQTSVDIALADTPVWIVGNETDHGDLVWAIGLHGGQVIFVGEGEDVEISTGQPFALAGSTLLSVDGQSPLNHPVMLPDGRLAAVAENGDVIVVAADGSESRLPLNALLDGRMMVDETGRLLVLANPSDRYGHGVLGDRLEPTTVVIINTVPTVEVAHSFDVPAARVIEGVMPIWVDLTGDGELEIIVTLADENVGAQLVVYNEQGNQIAASDSIGQGNRWRNQLAVGPFGPNGELELADVRTPHLSGTVEFFQLEEDMLVRVAAIPGYTSHVLGSRNLDKGIAGDFNGNGQPELLLPTLNRIALVGIERVDDERGAAEVWRVELPGRLTTNVAAVTRTNGEIAVAVGTDEGVLRVWGR